MLTAAQLAELLGSIKNFEELARESGVSSKTIQRLRRQENSPTLDTVIALVEAIKRLNSRQKQAA